MPSLPSGLPEEIAGGEEIVRFLRVSGHYRSNPPRVHYSAYLPNPKDWEASVVRRDRQSFEDLWIFADAELKGDQKAKGAGICSAADIRSTGVQLSAHEPPPRHANITGWPGTGEGDDPDLRRSLQREIATVIADQAELTLRPGTPGPATC